MVKIYQQPFAHAGTKQVIPDASDPQGFVSNEDGFTTDYELPDTDPNYKPIERAEFNGLMNMVTEAVGELQQFGFAKWQPITWPKGARVVDGGVVYRALNQTSQQPPHADWARDVPNLGTAATRNVGTGSGNVMEVGAFGLGRMPSNDYQTPNVSTFGVGFSFQPPNGTIKFGDYTPTDNSLVLSINQREGNNGLAISGSRNNEQVYVYFKQAYMWSNRVTLTHSGNLRSTSGQSTEYPMSQKAVTDALNTKVGLTGNQTISGLKTFSQFPVTPSAAPTANYQVANKKYVDDSAIGVGQTWQDVTGSRSMGTTYTNTTGKPIMVAITETIKQSGWNYIYVDGVVIGSFWNTNDYQEPVIKSFIVPANSNYRVAGDATLKTWAELR